MEELREVLLPLKLFKSSLWNCIFVLNWLLISFTSWQGTSLMFPWLRICLAMWGTQVRSLVRQLRIPHTEQWLTLCAATTEGLGGNGDRSTGLTGDEEQAQWQWARREERPWSEADPGSVEVAPGDERSREQPWGWYPRRTGSLEALKSKEVQELWN